jgi:hypothetical protein
MDLHAFLHAGRFHKRGLGRNMNPASYAVRLAHPPQENENPPMQIGPFAAAAAALLATSCANVTPPGILVATTPPGARILVDGRDSGFVTPCNLDVSEGNHTVELVLEGYATTSLKLREGSDRAVVPWSEGVVYPRSWAFPLFLPARDLFLPWRTDESPRPSRLHVEMRLSAAE